jgi:hypothetical protein
MHKIPQNIVGFSSKFTPLQINVLQHESVGGLITCRAVLNTYTFFFDFLQIELGQTFHFTRSCRDKLRDFQEIIIDDELCRAYLSSKAMKNV